MGCDPSNYQVRKEHHEFKASMDYVVKTKVIHLINDKIEVHLERYKMEND